jgi:hypothetical protein
VDANTKTKIREAGHRANLVPAISLEVETLAEMKRLEEAILEGCQRRKAIASTALMVLLARLLSETPAASAAAIEGSMARMAAE